VNAPLLRFPGCRSVYAAVTFLGSGLLVCFGSHPVEALMVELVELDAVGFVRDREIEDRRDECHAGGLAWGPARDLGSAFDFEIERLAVEDA
jgi:hypothetical protein